MLPNSATGMAPKKAEVTAPERPQASNRVIHSGLPYMEKTW